MEYREQKYCRRTSWLALLLFTLSAQASPLPLEQNSGVLRVGSAYEGKDYTGSGFLISYRDQDKDRTFLFTCAHLTGGTNVQVGGMPINDVMIGRRTDAFNDIDLVEIDSSKLGAKTFASYQPSNESEVKELNEVLQFVWEIPKKEAQGLGIKPLGHLKILPSSLQAWKRRGKLMQATPEISSDDRFSRYSVLVPPWSQVAQIEPSWTGRDKNWEQGATRPWFGISSENRPFSGTIWTPSRIAPGMSCAPLISKQGEVKGMGIEFRNKMVGSTFASKTAMLLQLNAYLENQPLKQIPATWKRQNDLLYLEMGSGNAEVVPLKVAGTPTNTPSGNGVSTPPGAKKRFTPEKCNPRELSATDEWKKMALAPAALWKNQPVIGFSIQTEGGKAPTLFDADRNGLKFQLAIGDKLGKVEPVPLGAPLLNWFDRRYLNSIQNDNFKLPSSYIAYADSSGSPEIKRTGILEGPVIDRYPDHMEITLHGPPPSNEKIQFSLNEKGALIAPIKNNPEEFLSLVEVPAPSGRVYLVDLSDIFFRTVEDWRIVHQFEINHELNERVHAGDPKLQGEKFLAHSMEELREPFRVGALPTISYREKCSKNQYAFQLKFLSPLLVSPEQASQCEDYGVGPLFRELKDVPAILDKTQ